MALAPCGSGSASGWTGAGLFSAKVGQPSATRPLQCLLAPRLDRVSDFWRPRPAVALARRPAVHFARRALSDDLSPHTTASVQRTAKGELTHRVAAPVLRLDREGETAPARGVDFARSSHCHEGGRRQRATRYCGSRAMAEHCVRIRRRHDGTWPAQRAALPRSLPVDRQAEIERPGARSTMRRRSTADCNLRASDGEMIIALAVFWRPFCRGPAHPVPGLPNWDAPIGQTWRSPRAKHGGEPAG